MRRREFLCALAASVVAAGAPLPIGFPDLSVERNLLGETEFPLAWRGYLSSAVLNENWFHKVTGIDGYYPREPGRKR